jgi:uncharacterized repeat protein (TIGR03803 family)
LKNRKSDYFDSCAPTKLGLLCILMAWSLVAELSAQTNFTVLKLLTLDTGFVPFGSLAAGPNGVLYGATAAGGVSNMGTVFRINQDGSSFAVLKSFVGADGTSPQGGVALTTNGVLYGATYQGGFSNLGTIFSLNTNGTGFQVLHHFIGGADGKNPWGELIVGSDTALYGVTDFTSSAVRGTVFKINQNGGGYTIIHTFTGSPDGQQPHCRLLQAADGMLYGTTSFGGTASQLGAIFRMNLDGSSYSVIHALQNSTSEGRGPGPDLCQSTNGSLYGTVGAGGSANAGAIFKVDADGNNYSLVRSFQTTGGDGQQPNTGVMEINGFLYGGTYSGGLGRGTYYKIRNDGSGYSVLRSFSTSNTNDFSYENPLIKGADGQLYGMTAYGGGLGAGCIFTLTDSPVPPRILSITSSGNSNSLRFAGTSDVKYSVLRSTNLTSWSTATNLTALVNGTFSYSESSAASPFAFFRLLQN